MNIRVSDPADLGVFVRAARKAQQLRQDDAAGSLGVSESFLGKVENGADGVHWGKLFGVLEGLGVRLSVDLPRDAAALVEDERRKLAMRLARVAKREAGDDEPDTARMRRSDEGDQ
ncbi:helix-turn-helix domain-containing protein [Paraburkholderia phosphatilytica]|uniref:helix-turn-helix domain-containing protein n=1 Tax=Paraburkholderia phosphatilytica TaxID=2282883 RepID=UPI000E504D39|nr:helix-turn-helix domain-containing protein [Paraburkholderia phosphatilytica]